MNPTGIPFELFTMIGGTLLGGLLKIWSEALETKRRQTELMLAVGRAQNDVYAQAREFRSDRGFHWTRRAIALIAVFFIVVWPKIVPVFWPDVPVTVGYLEVVSGFWPWSDAKDIVRWQKHAGLILTPLDTNLMVAVIGLFFGSEIAKRR